MGDVVCFRCGKPGHPRSECPLGTRGRPGTPGPAQGAAPEGEKKQWSVGVPPRRAPHEIAADPHGHANRIRELLGIHPTCPDPECAYDSPFRRGEGLHPIHACQLRAIAAEQVKAYRDHLEASS